MSDEGKAKLIVENFTNEATRYGKYKRDGACFWENDYIYLEKEIAEALRQARKEAFEEAAKIADERIACERPIPCPDGQVGCLVYHTVSGSREKNANEIATAIRTAGEKG